MFTTEGRSLEPCNTTVLIQAVGSAMNSLLSRTIDFHVQLLHHLLLFVESIMHLQLSLVDRGLISVLRTFSKVNDGLRMFDGT